MDATVKEKWVKALRSGDFTQGRFNLLGANGNCCLGVLACIMDVPRRKGLKDDRYSFEFSKTHVSCAMPPYGFHGISKDEMFQLIDFNDHVGLTFNEIADHIEANL